MIVREKKIYARLILWIFTASWFYDNTSKKKILIGKRFQKTDKKDFIAA